MLNCEQSRRRVDCMAATVLSHQRACWLAGFGTAIPNPAFIGLPDLSRIFLNVGVSTLDSNFRSCGKGKEAIVLIRKSRMSPFVIQAGERSRHELHACSESGRVLSDDVLSTRPNGKPYQGTAVVPVRRSHELHAVHGESVSTDAVFVRVCFVGRDSPSGTFGNKTESLASRWRVVFVC
jgi:hypothetical protein